MVLGRGSRNCRAPELCRSRLSAMRWTDGLDLTGAHRKHYIGKQRTDTRHWRRRHRRTAIRQSARRNRHHFILER